MADKNEFLRGKPTDASGEQRVRFLFKVTAAAICFLGIAAATQKFAYSVGYEAGWVGRALRVVRTPFFELPVYNPFMIFRWMFVYYRTEVIHPYLYSAVKFGAWFWGAAIGFYFVMEFILIRNRKENIFGTARWATVKDLQRAGLLGREGGVIIGQTADARLSTKYDAAKKSVVMHLLRKGKRYIIQSGLYNTLLAAPTRAGKGVSNVIPTLLSYPGSMIVLDFKGENFNMTSGWRAKFGKVYRWNPTGGADDPGHFFNPLAEIRSGDDAFADANLIADILCTPATGSSSSSSEHFTNAAKDFLTGLILVVLIDPEWENKSLPGCREYLAQQPPEEEKENTKWIYDKMLAVAEKEEVWPLVAQAIKESVGAQRGRPDDEGGSVRSTVNVALQVFADSKIKRNTSRSEFYINEFQTTGVPITLYMTIQYSDVQRISPLIRMFIILFSRRFTAGETDANHRKFKVPILFILDEFDKLGRMDELEMNAGIHNGFGIHYFWIFQSLNQLEKIYGKEHSFLAHARNSIFFAPGKGELNEAEIISKVCGVESFSKANISYSGTRGALGYGSASLSSQDQQRNLINADEVMNLPLDSFILLVQGNPPYIGKKNVFYEDPFYKDKTRLEAAFTSRGQAVKQAARTIAYLSGPKWYDAAKELARMREGPEVRDYIPEEEEEAAFYEKYGEEVDELPPWLEAEFGLETRYSDDDPAECNSDDDGPTAGPDADSGYKRVVEMQTGVDMKDML